MKQNSLDQLDIEDLCFEELEQRLEMASALVTADAWGGGGGGGGGNPTPQPSPAPPPPTPTPGTPRP